MALRIRLISLDDPGVREWLVPEELCVGGVCPARVRAHERGEPAVGVAVHGPSGDEGLPEVTWGIVARSLGDSVVERVLDCRAVRRGEVPGAEADVMAELCVRLGMEARLGWGCGWRRNGKDPRSWPRGCMRGSDTAGYVRSQEAVYTAHIVTPNVG